MTTLIVTVEERHEEELKKLLLEVPFKIEVREGGAAEHSHLNEPTTAYERLVQIQKEIGDKELFKEIKDPTEWQREIRKEWDRDF